MKRPSPSIVISLFSLVVALGGAGLAANGGPLLLGQTNTATNATVLSASVPNQALRVANFYTGSGATALELLVADGKPPMIVDSIERVEKLNADFLDGRHASQLVRVGLGTGQNST